MGANAALYTLNAVTVSTTEISVTAGGTTVQTKTDLGYMQLVVDASNMAAGDEFEFAVYEKVLSGGTQRKLILGSIVGVSDPLVIFPPLFLAIGWDFTILKKSGTDRAFTASVRSVT